jgi:GGDEF domain-containing protein
MNPETDSRALENVLLGRVLSDPETGLPNLPYFRLIREWEERQAKRRGSTVQVLKLTLSGGDDRVRRSMAWRLCREFRTSDLIASEGSSRYRLLLTSPDADHIDAIEERIGRLQVALNELYPSPAPLAIAVEVEAQRVLLPRGPCEPANAEQFETPATPHPRFEGAPDGRRGAEGPPPSA